MNRKEFYEKYGPVEVKFSYYYKYTFHYEGKTPEGHTLICQYGGDADEVYRHEVTPSSVETVNSLMPYAGDVIKEDKSIVDEFYDY